MDFISTIKSETDQKYYQMLDGTIDAPFTVTPKISQHNSYSVKRNKYYGRLNAEKSEFNNAIQRIKSNRDRRLSNEKSLRDEKVRKKFKRLQAIKTVVFLIPMILCIVIGYDVFNLSHGQMYKVDALENFSLGWTIALYVIFCIASILWSILSIVFMYKNETIRYKVKRYNVLAILTIVFAVALVGINLYSVTSHSDQIRVTFIGGDENVVEYVDKGASITLPSCSKRDKDKGDYVTKFTFQGWEINGEMYQPRQKYEPKGKTSIKAIFEEKDWATVSVSYSSASIKLYYDGDSHSPSSGSKIEIPIGTQIRVEVSFSYSDTTFNVNGSSTRSPYTFTLEKHTSLYATSSDPSCLVEGTQITLYDGSKKAVEDLQMGDILAVFNHETGKYEASPLLVNVHANEAADYYDVLNLHFSNGTSLRIIDEHGLFDKTQNKYVYINKENANEFIGHTFVASEYVNGSIQSNFIVLDGFGITNELVKIFNPASVWHINLIANDMLTLSAGMVNLFEYADNMQYDMVAMDRDIEQYGLYTYDDFKDYVSIEVFNAFPFKYYKVAISKVEFTFDRLLGLIALYNSPDSIK
ncbi:MAG: hypothetical protein HFK08_01710 [Clostridia bacterium]|nr:hypothetical protein [Clostridia bacterium]